MSSNPKERNSNTDGGNEAIEVHDPRFTTREIGINKFKRNISSIESYHEKMMGNDQYNHDT